jgi:eukaryotic-like serine/threonine-protein kinase
MGRELPGDDEDAEKSADPAPLGPAPAVADRERIRAAARARLFGPAPGSEQEAGASDPLAAMSGTIVADEISGSTSPESMSDADTVAPERLGRFEVLSRLGRGGMGEVYEAYDPELDRKVALKVLRPELRAEPSGDAGPVRLLREAQAMARLIDPHVITVHDVGTFGDQVFVAMELVEGQTLRAWLNDRPPWKEVLAVFARAGSGLAAAHRAGLVHRDFKPDNVLMGTDGRVRVVDFGLARAIADDEVDAKAHARTPTPEDGDSFASTTSRRPGRAPDPLQTPLTRSGAVMGTPAYMSPEQHMGRPADARSDQFSFCVALWEGLYHRRPFVGSNYAQLVHRVLGGRPTPPRVVHGPRWILQVLERGLAVDPAERHASMDALLSALNRDPSRVWRRVGVFAVVGALASAATWRLVGAERGTGEECANVLDRLHEVWGDERKTAVRSSLEAAVSSGSRIADTTVQMLDEFSQDWVAAATDACAAMLVTDRQSDPVLVTREACLETRLIELDELVGMLVTADAGLALEAVQAVATLSSVQSCADVRGLQGWRAPTDVASRERLGRVRAQLATAKARGLLGRHDDAIALAQSVIEAAHELDDPSTEAAGLLVRGQYEERAGSSQAEHTLREAVRRADVARDHVTRTHALIQLVWVVGQDSKRYEEARGLAAEARAVLKVLGGVPILEARLDNNLGVAAKVARQHAAALEAYERALHTQVELFGEEHPETARTLANLGTVLGLEGQHAEAEAMLRRALASFEAVLGDEHPLVAIVVGNLGQNLDGQKRTSEALPLLERSLAIRQANFDPTHPVIARSHYNLGIVLKAAGEHARAVQQFEIGLELRTRESDENDPSLHPWWAMLGLCYLELGQLEQAIPWLERALEARSDEAEHEIAWLRFDFARALVHQEPTRARTIAERAVAVLEADPNAAAKVATMRHWLQTH